MQKVSDSYAAFLVLIALLMLRNHTLPLSVPDMQRSIADVEDRAIHRAPPLIRLTVYIYLFKMHLLL